MTASTPPARHRRLKMLLTIILAIVAIPIVIVTMFMTASGERR